MPGIFVRGRSFDFGIRQFPVRFHPANRVQAECEQRFFQDRRLGTVFRTNHAVSAGAAAKKSSFTNHDGNVCVAWPKRRACGSRNCASENDRHGRVKLRVPRGIPGFVEPNLRKKFRLSQKRKQQHAPGMKRSSVLSLGERRRKLAFMLKPPAFQSAGHALKVFAGRFQLRVSQNGMKCRRKKVFRGQIPQQSGA